MDQDQTLKEVFHVAGDAPDPVGMARGRGVAPGYNLTKSALGHPMLLYRLSTGEEVILEADVYEIPTMDGKKPEQYIHILCPRCLAGGRKNLLTIRPEVKQFSYDKDAAVPVFPGWTREQFARAFPNGVGGLLSVAPFRCTWEEVPELRRDHGLGQCTWQVAIDHNVVRDA